MMDMATIPSETKKEGSESDETDEIAVEDPKTEEELRSILGL